jgi:hypothetical protein
MRLPLRSAARKDLGPPKPPRARRPPPKQAGPPVEILAAGAPTLEERQTEYVLRLRLRGLSETRIVQACRKLPLPDVPLQAMPPALTKSLLKKALDAVKVEEESYRGYAKAEQAQRLKVVLSREWNKQAPDMRTVMRAEELLSEIQGTKDPIKVSHDVRVQGALLQVIQALTPERQQEILTRARERKARLAALEAQAVPKELTR